MIAGCDSAEMIPDTPGTTTSKGTLTAVIGKFNQNASRAQVEINNQSIDSELFLWNQSDRFTMIDADAKSIIGEYETLGYTDDNKSGEADFMGKPVAEGSNYLAIYPAISDSTDLVIDSMDLSVVQSATMPDNSEESIIDYLSANMVMTASGTMQLSKSVRFAHECAMLRISLSNATDDVLAVNHVGIGSESSLFGTSMSYNLSTATRTISSQDNIGVTYDNMSIERFKSTDIYLLCFPGNDFDAEESLTISVDDATIEIPLSDLIDNGETKFEAGKRYWFKLIETNNGLVRESSIPAGKIKNQDIIKAIELNLHGQKLNRDEYGFVDASDSWNSYLIDQIDYISIYGNNISESDLSELKYLTNLYELIISNCSNMELLDISDLKNLTNLNQLTISNCPKLRSLDLSEFTTLENINIHGYPANINGYPAELREIKLPTSVKRLTLGGIIHLTELDLTAYSNLENLSAVNCSLKSIDLSNNPQLVNLNLSENLFEDIDLSNNLNLEELVITDNRIKELSLNNLQKLRKLSIGNNGMQRLDINSCPAVRYLVNENYDWQFPFDERVYEINHVTGLENGELTELATLYLKGVDVDNIDLRGHTTIKELTLLNMDLDKVDISMLSELEHVTLSLKGVTEIDFTRNAKLRILQCRCNLEDVDLSKNTELRDLSIEGNNIKSLDVSANTLLRFLYCNENKLSTLDITKNGNLLYDGFTGVRFGDQRGDSEGSYTELELKMTPDQYEMWQDEYEHLPGNNHVTVVVVE